MNVRPKNLTLAVAAGLAIGSASLDVVGSSLAVLIFTAVAVSTVAALVLAYVFGSQSVRPRLERFSDWLVANSSLVLNLSVVLLGALLVGIAVVNLV
ncbi:GAP family protein [Microbacterium schleiferi]|uniref:GAP family protein n=1 Tax=Microbacterium schleiferi TaxID=69362 RepID=A0A7S8N0P0_9MICO|nr:GAP family protein [Microbacterium schleiferi]